MMPASAKLVSAILGPSVPPMNAPTSVMRPAFTITYPPMRCERVHTCSLDSVHGVRMPKMKFDRASGIRLPSSTNSTPAPASTTVVMSMRQPSALPSAMTWRPASRATVDATDAIVRGAELLDVGGARVARRVPPHLRVDDEHDERHEER